jgi:hypothetical protein
MPVAIRTLFFPSWGDIVLKHYVVAGAELVGYLFTWGVAIVILVGAINEGDPVALIGGLIFAAFLLGLFHGIDAVVTYFVAKKGLHPKVGPTRSIEEVEVAPASKSI